MDNIENNSFPVVCIQEFNDTNNTSKVDTMLFFTYDRQYREYVLWGKRCYSTADPFMFRFSRFNDMDNFIYMCILFDKSSDKYSVTLNNYNNFPLDFDNDVTYDFLKDNLNVDNEITGYENISNDGMTRSKLRRWAHICKYSYNRIDDKIV
jgi:hypothetical protein